MYIKRDIADIVLLGAEQSPVIAIIGPRQSGKSTLCKKIFAQHAYVDMQDPNNLEFATNDPKGFLASHINKHGIVIDEAQYAPGLFNVIKVEVDKDRHNYGRYILSGSQNFLLSEKITESLAGRVFIYKLLPLSIKELTSVQLVEHTINQQIFKGFYPGLYEHTVSISKFYESYFYTYVERDVRTLRNIEHLSTFTRFIKLCIARIGQPLNITSLAAETGITVITAKAWISILEASFILFLLPSYHNNLSKRIIKSPKLFFYDVGLAAHIAGISQQELVEHREIQGQFFENMIIVDLIKECLNSGLSYYAYFYRDTNLKEVDLLLELPGKKIPIEIKSSQTLNSKFFDTIRWLKEELALPNNGVVIYGGDQIQKRSNANVYPWNKAYEIIKD